MVKRARAMASKRGKAKQAAASYAHMQGQPMDVANHPANRNMDPMGPGLGGSQMMTPGPMSQDLQ